MKIRALEIKADTIDVIINQDNDTILLAFDMIPMVIAELQRLYDERGDI